MALEFKIELGGNFVGALQKGNKELGETEKRAHKAGKEVELFESEAGKLNQTVGGLGINLSAIAKGGSLFTFDMAEGAAAVLETLKAIGEVALELGEKILDVGKDMLKVAGDAQELNLAVKLDVGQEGAEKVDKLAESFSDSAFSPKAIKEALLPILEESGTGHQDQWNDLATAATDVATRRKTGVEGAKTALGALNDIELNPQRLRGSLKELGIKQVDFYKDLGDLLHITADAAQKQTQAGKVQAKTLLSVALNQIAQREGGALGQATNEGAKLVTATWNRLRDLPERYFERIAESPALKRVADSVERAFQALDPESPTGQRIQIAIDDIIDKFGGFLDTVTSEEGINLLTNEIGEFADDIRVGVRMVESFAGALKEVFNIAVELGAPLKYIADLGDRLTGGGNEGGGALKNIVQQEKQKLLEALHSGAITPAQFAELAQKLPAFADGSVVSGPTIALIGEAGPEAVVPLGRQMGSIADITSAAGGFGTPSISYAPVYQFSGTSHDVREQIEDFDQKNRVLFKQLLDEVNAAVG